MGQDSRGCVWPSLLPPSVRPSVRPQSTFCQTQITHSRQPPAPAARPVRAAGCPPLAPGEWPLAVQPSGPAGLAVGNAHSFSPSPQTWVTLIGSPWEGPLPPSRGFLLGPPAGRPEELVWEGVKLPGTNPDTQAPPDRDTCRSHSSPSWAGRDPERLLAPSRQAAGGRRELAFFPAGAPGRPVPAPRLVYKVRPKRGAGGGCVWGCGAVSPGRRRRQRTEKARLSGPPLLAAVD